MEHGSIWPHGRSFSRSIWTHAPTVYNCGLQTQRTKISHYVPQCLTRTWNFEHEKAGKKQLRYYDVVRDAFFMKPASKFLVLDEPLEQPLEELFEHCLETPLARYFDRLAKDGSYQPDLEELVALKATLLLQDERTANNVSDLLQYGEIFFEKLVKRAEAKNDFVRLTLRSSRLYFPENGVIRIPMINLDKGATAIPVHPQMLLVMLPNDHEMFKQQLQGMFDRDETIFVALSTGTPDVKRVIVEDWLLSAYSEGVLRNEILRLRGIADGAHARMAAANDRFAREGLPADWFE